jgi:hypothetical protein
MANDSTLTRSMHDIGLAAWFGGSPMDAVGHNRAAAAVDQPEQRLQVTKAAGRVGLLAAARPTDGSLGRPTRPFSDREN